MPAYKGAEAIRYLFFIPDNYNSHPDMIVFRHGCEHTGHQTFGSAAEDNNLKTTTVRLRGRQKIDFKAV